MVTRWIITFLTAMMLNLTAGEYDLRTVIEMAEKNNIAIKLAQADLKMASAEKLQAFSDAFPKIDVDAGYNRNFKQNRFFFTVENPQTGELETSSFQTSFNNEFSVNAILRQTLFSFEVGYALQAANRLKKYTTFGFESVRQSTVTLAKQAFYQTLLLEKVAEVAGESEASAKENYENIKAKFDAGILSEFDLLQAEVRWQNSVPQTIEARKNYEQSLNNLKMMIGVSIDEEMVLKGSIGSIPNLPETPSINEVLGRRPDYNALIWQKRLQETNVKAKKALYLPRLEGTLRWSYAATSDEFKLEQDNDNLVLGLNLSIPIFSGGYNAAQVRRAQSEVDRVDAQISEANSNVRIELANIYLRLQEAKERVEATMKAESTARRAFDIAETRVDNGLSTQVELKDSRVALDQSQVNYYSAIFDYLSAFFDWQLATGVVPTNPE